MPTRRCIVAGGLFALLAAGTPLASAADETAKAFLTRIYNSYLGTNAKGMPINEAATLRLFTPALRKLITADAARAAKRGEVGNLDGDPFIDAQDWDIRSFAIDVRDVSPGAVKATVRFKNLDKDVTVALDLRKQGAGWRIDEIVGPGGSLRALLTAP